jgi:F-type H+-transporting ATPase subunit b
LRIFDLQSRRPFSLLSLLLCTVLAAGVTVAPLRATAQETGTAVSQSADAKPAPAESEEEKQAKGFLEDGPVVKWTAKTFNLPVGTAAVIFEVANFLIIALGIGIPLFKFLPKFLKARAAKLKGDIESARKVTEEANARLSAVEAKLAKLDEEIATFRAEVEAESVDDEARIKASLAEESARIVAASEQELEQSAAQARRSLRHFAADLAIDQAARQLVLTPQTDRALIAEFVADLSQGGKN